jgi:hypothetical protein
MGGGDDLEERVLASGQHGLDVARRRGLERRRGRPSGVGCGERAGSVDGKEELEVDRLLGP